MSSFWYARGTFEFKDQGAAAQLERDLAAWRDHQVGMYGLMPSEYGTDHVSVDFVSRSGKVVETVVRMKYSELSFVPLLQLAVQRGADVSGQVVCEATDGRYVSPGRPLDVFNLTGDYDPFVAFCLRGGKGGVVAATHDDPDYAKVAPSEEEQESYYDADAWSPKRARALTSFYDRVCGEAASLARRAPAGQVLFPNGTHFPADFGTLARIPYMNSMRGGTTRYTELVEPAQRTHGEPVPPKPAGPARRKRTFLDLLLGRSLTEAVELGLESQYVDEMTRRDTWLMNRVRLIRDPQLSEADPEAAQRFYQEMSNWIEWNSGFHVVYDYGAAMEENPEWSALWLAHGSSVPLLQRAPWPSSTLGLDADFENPFVFTEGMKAALSEAISRARTTRNLKESGMNPTLSKEPTSKAFEKNAESEIKRLWALELKKPKGQRRTKAEVAKEGFGNALKQREKVHVDEAALLDLVEMGLYEQKPEYGEEGSSEFYTTVYGDVSDKTVHFAAWDQIALRVENVYDEVLGEDDPRTVEHKAAFPEVYHAEDVCLGIDLSEGADLAPEGEPSYVTVGELRERGSQALDRWEGDGFPAVQAQALYVGAMASRARREVFGKDDLLGEEKEVKKRSLTDAEASELKLPKDRLECSVAHFEGKGFAAYTHRARSKFYEKPGDIPVRTLEFIGSTS